MIPYYKYVVSRLSDARRAALKDPEYIKKTKNILEWTLRFRQEYKNDKELVEFIEKKSPILGVSYHYVIASTSRSLILKMITDGDFDCDSRYLKLYFDINAELIAPQSPLHRLSKSQRELVVDFTFNNDYYRIFAYRLDKEYGKKITIGYPSREWIENELPTERMEWLRNTKKQY
jgi:hypothetical protein